MKKNILFFIVVLFSLAASSQGLHLYQKKYFIRGSDTLRYRLLLPENYNPSKHYPLILFLHGSGERGNDNEKQLVHGADLFVRDDIRKNFPAVVVFPQCPADDRWANYKLTDSNGVRSFSFIPGTPGRSMNLVIGLLQDLRDTFLIDKKRIYVGGLSMGGMGTFSIVNQLPKVFAAAFPICGAGDASSAKNMKKVNWWIFHGGKDDVVPPVNSMVMADALKKQHANVKLTIYPEANHNSWDSAFAEKELLPWLFSKHK